MEQEREDNLDKIISIYIIVYQYLYHLYQYIYHLLNQKKKKNLLNIRIKSTIIEFVDWMMKTINKKGRVQLNEYIDYM